MVWIPDDEADEDIMTLKEISATLRNLDLRIEKIEIMCDQIQSFFEDYPPEGVFGPDDDDDCFEREDSEREY